MSALVLAAPLAGWATRLDEVPDPAFAQGLVGDGVAIDPTSSELCAPCDGVVVSVHGARHACTLRADNGAEVLLHIGIDTVELRGKGFRALIAAGQRVRTGDPLIRFDMDVVARRARSLQSPVLLVGGEGFSVIERVQDCEVGVGDTLMAIARVDARSEAERTGEAAETAERRVRLRLPHGLHARPAAAFVRRAQQHAGTVGVACRNRSANGKSMASLMALDARLGDDLTITARGAQPEAAVSELAALVAAGLGDAIASALDRASSDRGGAQPAPDRASSGRAGAPPILDRASTGGNGALHALDRASGRGGALPTPDRASTTDNGAPPGDIVLFAAGEEVVLEGAAAAAGLALGRALRLADSGSAPHPVRDGAGAAIEQGRLAAALADLRREIEQTIAGAVARGDVAAGDIFRAHLGLIDDPEITGAAGREIAAGRSAPWAWRAALQELATVLRGLGNPLLAERTRDLDDLERRALALLAGSAGGRVPAELPEGAILVADEILPSELAAVPAGRIAGLCTARGGATSHVAILASGMGVPAVVAIGDAALCVPDGAPIIIDGDRGEVRVFPVAATRDAVQRAVHRRAERRRAALAAAHQPACTVDGVAIAVYANLGHVGEAAVALDAGAEGCGLLRTEFLFLDRHSAPSEDEQAARYQEIADALQGRPLVLRTLDAGGDKPLPYLPQAREDNPALGVRGVRLALRHPALLRAQLRAILRVQPAGVCRIMVPMIAAVAELRAVRAILEQERRALGVSAPVLLGAMIEVPAAALLADTVAGEADFFSIGTNDLAQYALAMDRGNRDVAAGLDSLHPGVLRLVSSTVRGARTRGRAVSVCGGAAADPLAVPIFLGLGVGTLSIAPAVVPEIKALVRTLSLARCTEVATKALELESREAVRALVVNTWPGLAVAHDGHHDRDDDRHQDRSTGGPL